MFELSVSLVTTLYWCVWTAGAAQNTCLWIHIGMVVILIISLFCCCFSNKNEYSKCNIIFVSSVDIGSVNLLRVSFHLMYTFFLYL
jgi:hypothetical protein